MTKHITDNALAYALMQMHLTNKGNLVLYLDKEVIQKSKELGFNLSKTFENHLKQLITQFSTCNSVDNANSPEKEMNNVGLPGFEPGSIEPKSTSLDQASRQPHVESRENIISYAP
jgi:Mn-dependent DtxR family transcriptional regulator